MIGKAQLVQFLYDDLKDSYNGISNVIGDEKLYGLTFYCASDFYGMGLVASTIESVDRAKIKLNESYEKTLKALEDHPDFLETFKPAPDGYAEIVADEWEYFLDSALDDPEWDDILDGLHDYANETDEKFKIGDYMSDGIICAIQQFQTENPDFKDIFTGLQFSDASEYERGLSLMVSSKINVEKWHSIMKSINND